jgi:hypothetical protein
MAEPRKLLILVGSPRRTNFARSITRSRTLQAFRDDYLMSTALPRRFREGAMKYLCLIFEDETVWQTMPKPEVDKLYAEYSAFKMTSRRAAT